MKRFKFRLEAVETIRNRREREAMEELGRARREHQAALDRKAGLEAALSEALIRRENLANSPVSPDAFRLIEGFIEGTRVRIRQAAQQVMRSLRSLERATRGYMHARRDVRVIETIREADYSEFKKELGRRELRLMDELTSARTARERAEA